VNSDWVESDSDWTESDSDWTETEPDQTTTEPDQTESNSARTESNSGEKTHPRSTPAQTITIKHYLIPQQEDSHGNPRTSLIWTFTRRLGGPMGRHVSGISRGWAYILATVSWLLCMVRQVPCVKGTSHTFEWMCYTDITSLYWTRGQNTGGIPYAGVQWEYPVLTGYFVTVANWISKIFGAVLSPDATSDQLSTNAHIYFAINAILLFGCLLWLINSVLRLAPKTPQLAMLVAVLPAVWTTGLINWDLLAVALTVAGLVAWKEERWIGAGIWLGLAVAAKFYPLVIIGALFVLCVRPEALRTMKKLSSWLIMVGVALATWFIVNAPVMFTHFDGWEYFYTFNSESRGADLGSLWYALSLMGIGVPEPAIWSRAVMVLGYVGLAVVIYIAKRAPNPVQIAYLAVAIMLVGNLVYSPQYVLWILPLVVLARPRALDLSVFAVTETLYFIFIWLFLGSDLGGGTPWVYILSILVRIAGTIFVMARVVRDMLHQQTSPVVPEEVLPSAG